MHDASPNCSMKDSSKRNLPADAIISPDISLSAAVFFEGCVCKEL